MTQGTNYIIDSLPEGYAVFDRPRWTNPDIVSTATELWDLYTDRPQRDRFLWGHPLGQYFPSTIQFFPHFLYLMKGGKEPCPCILCEKLAKKNQRIKGCFPAVLLARKYGQN